MLTAILKDLLILSALFISCTVEQERVVDCSTTDLVTSVFNDPIDLTYQGTIRVYTNVVIDHIITTKNNDFDKNYIDVMLEAEEKNGSDTKNLVIFTTPDFPSYASEQTAGRITLRTTYSCAMNRHRTLIFYQPFNERNYYSPKFSKPFYELVVPMPLFAGFDLSVFEEISAKDDDLKSNDIVFTLDPIPDMHYIGVRTKPTMRSDRMIYLAQLSLERVYLSLPKQIQFQITATDSGQPPRSSQTTVSIREDTTNSLPARPHFEQPVYSTVLSAELELHPFQIILQPETYSADVSFSKMGRDQKLFRLQSRDNIVEISLSDKLQDDDVQNMSYLELDIKAEHQKLSDFGRTAVIVMVPNKSDDFHFLQPLYEGLIDNRGRIVSPRIEFNKHAYNSQVEFRLHGSSINLFMLQQSVNILKLQLSSQFKLEDWHQRTHFNFEISASFKSHNDRTKVLIKLPFRRSPQFEKPLYVGRLNSLDDRRVLQLDTIKLLEGQEDQFDNKTQYNLEGEFQHLFELIPEKQQVTLHLLREPRVEEIRSARFSFLLVLTATRDGLRGFTTVIIEVPSIPLPDFDGVFEDLWQVRRIEFNASGHQMLSTNVSKLRKDIRANEFIFILEGDESQYFAFTVNAVANEVMLMLAEVIPEHVIESKSQIIILMKAFKIADEKINGSTIIFIELPRKECSIRSPATTLATSFIGPVFDTSYYIFTANPNQLGVIGTVNAIIEGSNVSIKYTLSVENDLLAPHIGIDKTTGSLQLLSYVSPGIYEFKIWAHNVETLTRANVAARLQVESVIQCEGQQPSVASSLLTKYIEEEKEHKDIMSMSLNGCEFQIFSMHPNDKAYVKVDVKTKMLTTIAIDREDSIFINMSEPHIQIKLKLICDSSRLISRRQQQRDPNKSSSVLGQDIPFAQDVTILKLIIVDINDNAPEFIYPLGPTHIGYPEGNICLELFPENLMQLQAIDKDQGLNSRLRYSMRPDIHFSIDAVNGILYPKANAFRTANSTTLIVTARDREGAADGLTTGAVVVVKILRAEHFTLLTLQHFGKGKGVKEVLRELETKTQFQIGSLKVATVPGVVAESNRSSMLQFRHRGLSEESTFLRKVWIYALDAKGEPVSSDEIKRGIFTLSDDNKVNRVFAETYDEVGLARNQTINRNPLKPLSGESNNSGYITAVMVLSPVLVLVSCFLLWHLYLQHHVLHRCKSPSFSQQENDMEKSSSKEVSTKSSKKLDAVVAPNIQSSPPRRPKAVVPDVTQSRAHVRFTEFVEPMPSVVVANLSMAPINEYVAEDDREEKNVRL